MSLYIIMSKSVWGPATWFLLHSIVIKIRDDAPNDVIIELKKIINGITSNLPCPVCSSHAKSQLIKLRFESITTVEGLRQFMFVFHRAVNEFLKKPILMTYQEHLIIYNNMELTLVIKNFLNIYNNMSNTNVTMMLYSFHRKTLLTDINNYFVKYQGLYRL
jgi:hypothetical protein